MDLDDELCLCFHVSRRKVENFLRQTKPQRASQLSECFGAGTGCGWCRPFLRRLWERSQASLDPARPPALAELSPNSPSEPPPTVGWETETIDKAATSGRQKLPPATALPNATDYAQQREAYRQKQRGERPPTPTNEKPPMT